MWLRCGLFPDPLMRKLVHLSRWLLLPGFLFLLSSQAFARVPDGLVSLGEDELATVSGAGIAIALDNFQFAMAPTSYFEQAGSAPINVCTAVGNVAGNRNCWRRGDLRWYGINISGATTAGFHWNDSTVCTPSAANNCPRGGRIAWFSPFDNPYIIRAWSPQGMNYNGDCINGTDGASGCNDANVTSKTLYEYLAPTARNGANTGPGQPDYVFSFWGEIEAGSTRNSQTQPLTSGTGSWAGAGWGLLKSQTIIRGNAAGSVFRMFQFPQAGNQTFGMYYHSYLRGDFRFSVNQGAAANDNIGQAPVFAATEGLTFRNVEAFLPFGQLYYQALTLGAVGTGGNFYLQLTPIPNTATVYAEYYGLRGGDSGGYETARCNLPGASACGGTTYNSDYAVSHGYSRWGDWYPGGAGVRNSPNEVGDGIVMRACSGCTFFAFAKRPKRIDVRGPTQSMQTTQYYNCASDNGGGCALGPGGTYAQDTAANNTRTYPSNAVNLGDARAEGLLINQFRLESCPKTGAC